MATGRWPMQWFEWKCLPEAHVFGPVHGVVWRGLEGVALVECSVSLETGFESLKAGNISNLLSLLHACSWKCELSASCSGHHAFSLLPCCACRSSSPLDLELKINSPFCKSFGHRWNDRSGTSQRRAGLAVKWGTVLGSAISIYFLSNWCLNAILS